MNWKDFIPLFQALIVGIFGVISVYIFGRAKYRAEVKKLEAEADLAAAKKQADSALANAQAQRELASARKGDVEATASLVSLLKELGMEFGPKGQTIQQPVSVAGVVSSRVSEASDNIAALAMEAMYEGKREQAILYIRRIVSSDKRLGSAVDYHNLGIFALQISDYILARDVFEKGVHFYPHDVDLLCNLGQAYDLTADAVKAELVFKQVGEMELGKQNWRYYAFYSTLLVKQGRTAGILQLLSEGVKQLPGESLLWRRYAQVVEESGDLEKVKSVFLSAIQADPSSAVLHFEFSEYCWRYGMLEEAYEHLTDAIRFHNYPKDSFLPVAYKLKARVAYELGKIDETKQTLKAAIQLNPEDMDLIALQAIVA